MKERKERERRGERNGRRRKNRGRGGGGRGEKVGEVSRRKVWRRSELVWVWVWLNWFGLGLRWRADQVKGSRF